MTVPPPVLAQEGLGISTPYPTVVVEPGKTASFNLDITAPERSIVDLTAEGIPDGWEATFRGGTAVVNSVTVGPDGSPSLSLDIKTPAEAGEGDYEVTIEASTATSSATLDVVVKISMQAGGNVVMTPEFPALRGPSDAKFDFEVTIENDTPVPVNLELEAEGPQGWRVQARPAGESQASSISVEPGSSGRVTVEARPPIGAQAGTYDIVFRARGDGHDAELGLIVQIIGAYALELNTADQRLNAEVTAGTESELPLVVINTGSAPLLGVEMSATPPRNWEVSFEPEALPELGPGEVANITATVVPSSEAIAGDYRVTFRARTDQVDDSIEVRATVNPSVLWGLIGVGIIALTLGGLALVFRRFGRR